MLGAELGGNRSTAPHAPAPKHHLRVLLPSYFVALMSSYYAGLNNATRRTRLGVSVEVGLFWSSFTGDAKNLNDPKLSDSRSWRAGCVVGERRRLEAASVTAAAVRCSA